MKVMTMDVSISKPNHTSPGNIAEPDPEQAPHRCRVRASQNDFAPDFPRKLRRFTSLQVESFFWTLYCCTHPLNTLGTCHGIVDQVTILIVDHDYN